MVEPMQEVRKTKGAVMVTCYIFGLSMGMMETSVGAGEVEERIDFEHGLLPRPRSEPLSGSCCVTLLTLS